ncbi:MAG: hypothetical protein FWE32_10805 [Oscillospiraceae bacterium]|nr:hypothetical protein [Oscillospiraceae bacterium]
MTHIRGAVARNREVYRQAFGRKTSSRELPRPEAREVAFPAGEADQYGFSGVQDGAIAQLDLPRMEQESVFLPPVTETAVDERLDDLIRAFEREGRMRAQDLQGEEY